MNVSLWGRPEELQITNGILVYRINWLRAKARADRWSEELKIVQKEMEWTMNWFKRQENNWKERAQQAELGRLKGHVCYAEKQQVMWKMMYTHACDAFQTRDVSKI